MIKRIFEFQDLFNSKKIDFFNKYFNTIIYDFNFYIILENNFKDQINEITKQKNALNIIITNRIGEPNDQYFIVILDHAIILISESDFSLLSDLLINLTYSKIFTFSNDLNLYLPIYKQHDVYQYENWEISELKRSIQCFSEKLKIKTPKNKEIQEIWSLVCPNISSYLINKGYEKLRSKKKDVYKKENKKIDLSYDKFIFLQTLGKGSSSTVQLIYHFELEEFFAISFKDSNDEKLLLREMNNYKNIQHPSIPKFYGKGKIMNTDCLIIEYIRGVSLKNIKNICLTEFDKIKIIMQLLLVFEYLQNKKFIYRDLKPDNLIIDEKKNLILFDFDRMINCNEQEINDDTTKKFCNFYMCPEIKNNKIKKYSFKEDIYSIGLIIYFIIFEEIPTLNENYEISTTLFPDTKFLKIIKECTEKEPENRTIITKLVDYFYNFFIFKQDYYCNESININKMILFPQWMLNNDFMKIYTRESNFDYNEIIHEVNSTHLINQYKLGEIHYDKEYFKLNFKQIAYYFLKSHKENNDPESIFYAALIYYKYIPQEIKMAINFFTISADMNYAEAQYYLGLIYYEGKYVKKDMRLSIYYFTLAVKQNHSESQYYLGLIFLNHNQQAAIYFLTLSSNQNNPKAQYLLGYINYSKKNYNKAIYYLTLSANQNYPRAMTSIGIIYYQNNDLVKSIYYFKLASDLKEPTALFYLGFIYFENNVSKNIDKAVYYFTLAAKENQKSAQLFLGMIYHNKDFGLFDIDKAIHYSKLAANQGCSDSQFLLGYIYYAGEYVQQDINKSIYYFSLSAKQGNSDSQLFLGTLYFQNVYVLRDINKALYFATLSAKQHNLDAYFLLGRIYLYLNDIEKGIHYLKMSSDLKHTKSQYYLGQIYYENKYHKRDVDKAIYFLSLAANKNLSEAQHYLARIYYYEKKDINKTIYYCTLAAKLNNPISQYDLFAIYMSDERVKQDVKKGIYFLIQSSKNKFPYSYFPLGFFYHEGKYIEQDVHKAIHFYKQASNHYSKYAKNNLGVIFKNGFFDKIKSNISFAIEYFNEAITKSNDYLSMYNLSSIYIYDLSDQYLDKAIELLFLCISTNQLFYPSYYLLVLALIKKYGYKIDEFIKQQKRESNKLYLKITEIIDQNDLLNKYFFDALFEYFRGRNYLYNYRNISFDSEKITKRNYIEYPIQKKKDLTNDFYDGFGQN